MHSLAYEVEGTDFYSNPPFELPETFDLEGVERTFLELSKTALDNFIHNESPAEELILINEPHLLSAYHMLDHWYAVLTRLPEIL